MRLRHFPLTLEQANLLVEQLHRHHKPATGHRFSIGAFDGDTLVGACIVGRPVAHKTPQYLVAEVSRLVTNGHRNACSFLYAKAAQTADGYGFWKIQTFILASESGASLKAAGWTDEGLAGGLEWNGEGKNNTHPAEMKHRWARILNPGNRSAPAILESKPAKPEPILIGRQERLEMP